MNDSHEPSLGARLRHIAHKFARRRRAIGHVIRHELAPLLIPRRLPATQIAELARPVFAGMSQRRAGHHLALIVGHFSFDNWCATFGDTEAMRVVMSWLDDLGIDHDVACHPSNGLTGVNLWTVEPTRYTIVVFVCGPWTPADHDVFLVRFPHCTKIAVNVSMIDPDDASFDHVIARDMAGTARPDIAFERTAGERRPLLGLFIVHEQPEYGERQAHDYVNQIIADFFESSELDYLALDTLHVDNHTSTPTLGQLEAVLRRVDVVITTRLHGMVLSLRVGVPCVAIDPIVGGGKVRSQAHAVGWPHVLGSDELTVDSLRAMVDECRNQRACRLAGDTVAEARHLLRATQSRVLRPRQWYGRSDIGQRVNGSPLQPVHPVSRRATSSNRSATHWPSRSANPASRRRRVPTVCHERSRRACGTTRTDQPSSRRCVRCDRIAVASRSRDRPSTSDANPRGRTEAQPRPAGHASAALSSIREPQPSSPPSAPGSASRVRTGACASAPRCIEAGRGLPRARNEPIAADDLVNVGHEKQINSGNPADLAGELAEGIALPTLSQPYSMAVGWRALEHAVVDHDGGG